MGGCLPSLRESPKAGIDMDPGRLVPIGPDSEQNDPKANKINVIFSAINFEASAHTLTQERARVLANSLILSETGQGFLDRTPFRSFQADYQFWIWEEEDQPVTLARSASQMCSASGEIDAVDSHIEGAIQGMVTGPVVFMNLLNTECRPQGTWLKINGIENLEERLPQILSQAIDRGKVRQILLSDPGRLMDVGALRDVLTEAIDYKKLASEFFQRFKSPRTYLPVKPSVVAGQRGFTMSETVTMAGHEAGHAVGRLWDLYAEGGDRGEVLSDLTKWMRAANRDYDLVEVSGLRKELEALAALAGFSVEIPPVWANPFRLLVRRAEVAEVLGTPLGWPHCATSASEGREWAANLGVDHPEIFFEKAGCLYMDASGPFVRSSDSIMFLSNSGEFDPVELAWMKWLHDCQLRKTPNACQNPPWE